MLVDRLDTDFRRSGILAQEFRIRRENPIQRHQKPMFVMASDRWHPKRGKLLAIELRTKSDQFIDSIRFDLPCNSPSRILFIRRHRTQFVDRWDRAAGLFGCFGADLYHQIRSARAIRVLARDETIGEYLLLEFLPVASPGASCVIHQDNSITQTMDPGEQNFRRYIQLNPALARRWLRIDRGIDRIALANTHSG